jgi:hypothetical protein
MKTLLIIVGQEFSDQQLQDCRNYFGVRNISNESYSGCSIELPLFREDIDFLNAKIGEGNYLLLKFSASAEETFNHMKDNFLYLEDIKPIEVNDRDLN